MSFNLIEAVGNILSGDVMNKMAGKLGESSANVQQALQIAIPSILTGVLMKAKKGDMNSVRNLIMRAAWQDMPLNKNGENLPEDYHALDLLNNLFGEKTADISGAIAGTAGVSQQSALAVMSTTAPVALGVLGKYMLVNDMNMQGFRALLRSQKKNILEHCPPGIFTDGFMSAGKLSRASRQFKTGASENNDKPPVREIEIAFPEKKSFRWVLPFLIILMISGMVGYFTWQSKNTKTVPIAASPSAAISNDSKKNIVVSKAIPQATVTAIPDIKPGSIEDQLTRFLSDPQAKPSKKFQFDFDRVSFRKGKAIITDEGSLQIQAIAAILKAYPKTKIKIGAFNAIQANEMDSMINEDLSEERAAAVSRALNTAGVSSAQLLGFGGFGSDFAKYDASAPDSLREKDNRISISVRAK